MAEFGAVDAFELRRVAALERQAARRRPRVGADASATSRLRRLCRLLLAEIADRRTRSVRSRLGLPGGSCAQRAQRRGRRHHGHRMGAREPRHVAIAREQRLVRPATCAGAVGSSDSGSRPSAPLVTTIRLFAGFQPLRPASAAANRAHARAPDRTAGMSETIAACGSSASRSLRTLASMSPAVAGIAAKATGPSFGTAQTKLLSRPK